MIYLIKYCNGDNPSWLRGEEIVLRAHLMHIVVRLGSLRNDFCVTLGMQL